MCFLHLQPRSVFAGTNAQTQDMRGEPVTAEQLQKIIGGEFIGTRDMQSVAGDVKWRAPLIFISNDPPPWQDPNGALMNRLMKFQWRDVEGTRDSRLKEKILTPKKLTAATMCMLTAYADLRRHIKNTPAPDWDYEYITNANRELAQEQHPFVSFMLHGEFNDGTDTFKLEYVQGEKTLLTDVQEVYNIYRLSILTLRDTERLSAAKWRGYVKQVSNSLPGDQTYTVVDKVNFYLCKECGQDNSRDVAARSTCTQTCASQLPPRAHLSANGARHKGRHAALKQSSKTLGATSHISNLKLTRTSVMGGSVQQGQGRLVSAGGILRVPLSGPALQPRAAPPRPVL